MTTENDKNDKRFLWLDRRRPDKSSPSHNEKSNILDIKMLKRIYCFLETMGRVRAASVLARSGRAEMAKRVMLEKSSCCCWNGSTVSWSAGHSTSMTNFLVIPKLSKTLTSSWGIILAADCEIQPRSGHGHGSLLGWRYLSLLPVAIWAQLALLLGRVGNQPRTHTLGCSSHPCPEIWCHQW